MMKTLFSLLLISLFPLRLLTGNDRITICSIPGKTIVYEQGFEDSSNAFEGTSREYCCSWSQYSSDSISRGGKRSLRIQITSADTPLVNNSYRSEIVPNVSGRNGTLYPEDSTNWEGWFAWSVFVPASHVADPEPEICGQWHEVPDWDLGEYWRSPPVSIWNVAGKWELHQLWDSRPVNAIPGNEPQYQGRKVSFLGNVDYNNWTKFICRIKWSSDTSAVSANRGFIQIWKDGTSVYNYIGPTSFNDKNPPYFKLGIYKWPWGQNNRYYRQGEHNTNNRIYYFDDIKISKGSLTYTDL